MKPIKTTLSVAAALALGGIAHADTPILTVMTYDSFVSDWGPGPAIEAAFEETCGCDLQFVGAGDGAALLARLQLEGPRTEADIVLGLDTNLTSAARQTGLFAPHGVSAELDLPVTWNDPDFLPFDWGYFAFVGNVGATAPKSLQALASSDVKIVIQDPRSSTPGLGLMMWVKAATDAGQHRRHHRAQPSRYPRRPAGSHRTGSWRPPSRRADCPRARTGWSRSSSSGPGSPAGGRAAARRGRRRRGTGPGNCGSGRRCSRWADPCLPHQPKIEHF